MTLFLYLLGGVFAVLALACLIGALKSPPPSRNLLGDEAEDYLYRQAFRDAELRRLRRR